MINSKLSESIRFRLPHKYPSTEISEPPPYNLVTTTPRPNMPVKNIAIAVSPVSHFSPARSQSKLPKSHTVRTPKLRGRLCQLPALLLWRQMKREQVHHQLKQDYGLAERNLKTRQPWQQKLPQSTVFGDMAL